MSKPTDSQEFLWIPRNFPEGSVRTELNISGSTETTECLNNIISNVESPFDSFEDEEGLVLISENIDA